MGAVIGPHDLKLLERLEDQADLDRVRAALAEGEERISFEELRKELGL